MIDGLTLWISLKTAASATVISGISGLAAAAFMVRQETRLPRRLFMFLDTLFLAPLVLPPTVLGFILLVLFGAQSPVGQVWEYLLGEPLVFSWLATVLAASVVAFPLMYRTSRAALLQVEPNLLAAARTLSSRENIIFFRVMLPVAYPGVIAGLLLAFARSLGEFGATLMVAGSIPGRTRTIPMAIYYAVESGDWREAALWSGIIMFLSLAVVFVAEGRFGSTRFLARSISSRGGRFQALDPVPSVKSRGQLQLHVQKNIPGFPLDLQIQTSSRRIAVLGSSGSGKSLFLRCLAGLEHPDQGWILSDEKWLYDSTRALQLSPKQRRVGMLFQHYALFPGMTIRDNICFGMGSLPLLERQQKADIWLQKIGLQDFGDRRPHQLSGGQQQRVALARALAAEPELLLLDEPFTALDTHLRQQLEQQLLQDLQTFPGRLLLVTHNVEEAWRLCELVIILEQGRIIRQGSKEEVFADPQTVEAAQLTGCKNIVPVTVQPGSMVRVDAWQCSLQMSKQNGTFDSIGIRAHHAQLSPTQRHDINSFPCWLARTTESPHRLSFFLKINSPALHPMDHHLQVELLREKALAFHQRPQPWFIHLPPDRLLPLQKLSD